MLEAADTLELPAGVTLAGGVLRDGVRAVALPVNPAGVLVLERAGQPLGDIASELAEAFGLGPRRALDDVLAFVWELNHLGLANVRRRAGRAAAAIAWLVLALRLLPTASLPPTLTRRSPLDTTSGRAATIAVIRALAPRAAVIGAMAAMAVLQAASMSGRVPVVLALAMGGGVAAAIIFHEAGHAATLARASPAALLLGWRRISVIHAPVSPARAQLVALAGPLSAALLGLTAATLGAAVQLPELALGATPLAGHALGLTAFSTDGRKACGT